MMMIEFFSPAHILSLLFAAGVFVICYLALRGKSLLARRSGVFVLMLVNLFQHFYKSLVWPHLWGSGFGLINTAYNVCAFMIIFSPVFLLTDNRLLKNFTAVIGTACGAALLFPTWFYGQTPFQWEYLRAWFCHTLLVTTSLLLPALNLTELDEKHAFCIGGLSIAGLQLVLIDNALCYYFGLVGGDSLAEALYRLNPLWMMAPPDGFPPALLEGLRAVMPFDLPILWYAVPLFTLVSFAAFAVSLLKTQKKKRKTFVSRFFYLWLSSYNSDS